MPWTCFMAETEEDKAKPGAMWFDENGEWVVMLPCGDTFHEKEEATNGGGRWSVSGTPPNVTVNPSINYVGLYHGWLQNGVFSDDPAIPRDVDGRRIT